MAIVDIRGTHGSGKSWIPRQLIAADPARVEIRTQSRVVGYFLPGIQLAITGRYATACGGCDGIKSADEVCARVRTLARGYPNVLLEGILVAHTFKRYNALAQELEALTGRPYYFCFLDTPLPTCVARVNARRRAEGKANLPDPRNVIKDWHRVWRGVRRDCTHAGRRVVVLDHRDPLPALLGLLE